MHDPNQRNPINTPEYKAFVGRLVNARKRAGLKQSEAAARMGVHQVFVSKCERAERRVDIIEASLFAKAYGVTLDYLAGMEEQ